MTKILKLLPRFCRRSEGATAVEFGFVVPILVAFIFGIMEFSMITFATSLLEGGLREASRFGITGNLPAGATSREEHLITVVNAHGAGIIKIDDSNLTVKAYPNFSKIGEPEPFTDLSTPPNGVWDAGEPYTDINCNGQWDDDMGKAGAGAGGEVVLYSIDYEKPLMVGFLAPLIGQNGTFPMHATVAVRNEPFEGGDELCS